MLPRPFVRVGQGAPALGQVQKDLRFEGLIAEAASRSHSSARSRESCGVEGTNDTLRTPSRMSGSTVLSLCHRRSVIDADDEAHWAEFD